MTTDAAEVISWTVSLGALSVAPTDNSSQLYSFAKGLTVSSSSAPSSLFVTNPFGAFVRLWFFIENNDDGSLFSWSSSWPCTRTVLINEVVHCGLAFVAELYQEGSSAFGGTNQWQPTLEPQNPDLSTESIQYSTGIELLTGYVGLELAHIESSTYFVGNDDVDVARICDNLRFLVVASTGEPAGASCSFQA